MSRPTDFKVALAVGAAGAFVDVSDFLEGTSEVTYRAGRQSAFDDFVPGEFSFVLNNADGRFTPDNASSVLVTKVTEGMNVCWQTDSRLVAGTITSVEPQFPDDIAAWSTVRITADDELGELARNELIGLVGSVTVAANPYWFYRLDDEAGSTAAQEFFGAPPMVRGTSVNPVFGVDAVPAVGDDQVRLARTTTVDAGLFRSAFTDEVIVYPSGTCGVFSFWLTLEGERSATSSFTMSITRPFDVVSFGIYNGSFWGMFNGLDGLYTDAVVEGNGAFFVELVQTFVGSTVTSTVYANGVVVATVASVYGSAVTNAGVQVASFGVSTSNSVAVADSALFSHISHTPARIPMGDPFLLTEGERLTQISRTTPAVVMDSLPSDLSVWPIGEPALNGVSALDAINEVLVGEQGSIFQSTTGTLTAPVPKYQIRARLRSETVTATFDVEDDLSGSPDIIRDITDMISRVTVAGAERSVTVVDPALVDRVGSKNASETVLFTETTALREYGSDRLLRGSLVALKVGSFTVDAMTTPTDRWADLLGLQPGDRVRITGLPSTQLGFSTWDGWFLGRQESHTVDSHQFTLFFEPCSPATAIFDTNLFMADGELTLTTGINSAVTSLSVTSVGATLSTTETPYTITIGDELMTATTVTGATPQIVTVVRGVGGSTATAHLAGALVDISPSSLYAY